MIAIASVIGLFMLVGALCGGAVYGFFGHYWYVWRQSEKDDRD
jgi:hypothetical protein